MADSVRDPVVVLRDAEPSPQSGRWAKTITKSRRALPTLILPTNVKEKILADAQDFLASEKWYRLAGIPHRRGEYFLLSLIASAHTFRLSPLYEFLLSF